MKNLKTLLKNRLRNAKKIAVLGIGSELRGDDAAGILVARQIDEKRSNFNRPQALKVFFGFTAPENLTSEVRKFKPEHLVIVDSADMNQEAGSVKLINSAELGGFSSCTHKLPLKMLAEYLIKSIGCDITIIGIQPKALEFAKPLSSEVKKSAKDISEAFNIILSTSDKAHA